MHDEVELAELAAAGVRALDPLLQAGLVDIAEGAGAVTGGDEGKVRLSLAVADAAHVLQAVAAAGRHRRRLRRVAAVHPGDARGRRRRGTQGVRRLQKEINYKLIYVAIEI